MQKIVLNCNWQPHLSVMADHIRCSLIIATTITAAAIGNQQQQQQNRYTRKPKQRTTKVNQCNEMSAVNLHTHIYTKTEKIWNYINVGEIKDTKTNHCNVFEVKTKTNNENCNNKYKFEAKKIHWKIASVNHKSTKNLNRTLAACNKRAPLKPQTCAVALQAKYCCHIFLSTWAIFSSHFFHKFFCCCVAVKMAHSEHKTHFEPDFRLC